MVGLLFRHESELEKAAAQPLPDEDEHLRRQPHREEKKKKP